MFASSYFYDIRRKILVMHHQSNNRYSLLCGKINMADIKFPASFMQISVVTRIPLSSDDRASACFFPPRRSNNVNSLSTQGLWLSLFHRYYTCRKILMLIHVKSLMFFLGFLETILFCISLRTQTNNIFKLFSFYH